jgi:hypothetical protein
LPAFAFSQSEIATDKNQKNHGTPRAVDLTEESIQGGHLS